MAAIFDADAAKAKGQNIGDGTPVHITMPTANPWVPLRILGTGKNADDRIEADVYLLTDRRPVLLPAPFANGMQLEHSATASASLLDDLRSDKGMDWIPEMGWLTKIAINASASQLTYTSRSARRHHAVTCRRRTRGSATRARLPLSVERAAGARGHGGGGGDHAAEARCSLSPASPTDRKAVRPNSSCCVRARGTCRERLGPGRARRRRTVATTLSTTRVRADRSTSRPNVPVTFHDRDGRPDRPQCRSETQPSTAHPRGSPPPPRITESATRRPAPMRIRASSRCARRVTFAPELTRASATPGHDAYGSRSPRRHVAASSAL